MFILSSQQCSKSCVYFNMDVNSEDASEVVIFLIGKFNGNGPNQVRESLIVLLSDP